MITFENVSKSFGSIRVLKNINLNIQEGETFCLLGNSGSGKTTLLKLINKLISPNEGSIYFQGQDVNSITNKKLRKNIGYVIQTGGLFPHLTIGKNISLPMKLFGADKTAMNARTRELINQIGLDESYLKRYPATLSGGQQQRVGIARAIANHPELLLLDEPFSALDPVLRDQMQNDFLEMKAIKEITKVMVTHDLKEALKLGNRICLMSQGEIQFIGTPVEFLQSENIAVKDYLGEERVALYISQMKFKDLIASIPPTTNNPVSEDIFIASEQTSVYQVINNDKPFVRLAEGSEIYADDQIKKAFLKHLAEII